MHVCFFPTKMQKSRLIDFHAKCIEISWVEVKMQ